MIDKLAIAGGKPTRKTYLPYGSQSIDETDIKRVVETLKSDWITQGPKVEEFEKEVAKYCGAKYAVAVATGTAALHCATYASGLDKGMEGITSPITFAASANSIEFRGAKPRFADINQRTYNISPSEIKRQINQKTKVLIPVDFTGQPCEIDEINEIAIEEDLAVIQDSAHGFGSLSQGRKLGSLADMTIFSFHPVKHLTTGEGGIILTNNEEYFEKMKLFRTHGITNDKAQMEENHGPWYYEMKELGYNYRITDIQCALGISQLSKIDQFIKRRRQIATIYDVELSKFDEILTPYQLPSTESSYHLYVVKLNLEKLRCDRKKIFDALRAENIGVHVHYIPVHLQPYYRKKYNYKKGSFPNAEDYYDKALTLPLFPKMTDNDAYDVITSLRKVLNHYKK